VKKVIRFLVVFVIMLQAGCVRFTKYEPVPDCTQRYEEPRSEIQARGGNLDWGICLSGGGIRSGAFSLGALKSLYDRGYLEQVDVVSVVSGGGYAWYWVLSNNDGQRNFGESVFSDEAWPRRNAELQVNAKFAPYGTAASQFFLPVGAGAGFYERRIVQFGHSGYRPEQSRYVTDVPCEAMGETIDSYAGRIRSKKIPYFIVNATMSTPRDGAGKLIEITPTHIGNSTFGYTLWATNRQEPVIGAPQAFAISGAALTRRLAQKVPDYLHHKGTEMTLYDGGGGSDRGENLGAYALVRQGIPNIIIIDAEADPKYNFKAYTNLQALLEKDCISFRVDDIDRHLANEFRGAFGASSMSRGLARGTNAGGRLFKSDIYYIKMCMPGNLFLVNTNKQKYAVERADDISVARVDNIIRPRGRLSADCLGELDELARRGLKLDDGYYRSIVRDYASYLNYHPGWRTRFLNALPGDFFQYSFPHMTTADQGYYNDQIEALVGLGFLQASAMPHVGQLP
jgi:hypothetical protein